MKTRGGEWKEYIVKELTWSRYESIQNYMNEKDLKVKEIETLVLEL